MASDVRRTSHPDPRQTVGYTDAAGHPTDDPAAAVAAEVVELDVHGRTRRTRLFLERHELPGLPMSEPAFLVWVLVALMVVWIVIGIVLRLT